MSTYELQRALKDPQLKDDVASAVSAIQERGFGKGHPDAIEALGRRHDQHARTSKLTPSSRTQVPEALKAVQQAARAPSARSPAPPSVDPAEIISAVVGLATDREQQAAIEEEIEHCALDAKGLETPAYTVEGAIRAPKCSGARDDRAAVVRAVHRRAHPMANDVGDVAAGPGCRAPRDSTRWRATSSARTPSRRRWR